MAVTGLLTLAEAEERTGLGRSRLTLACRQGEIDGAFLVGGRMWLVSTVALDKWIRERRLPGRPSEGDETIAA